MEADMRVLVACEESQKVTNAFRNKGHEAWSCDILETRGNPDYHIQGDVSGVLANNWDMIIAFPPCTDLCVSGARWFEAKRESGAQQESIKFFMQFIDIAGRVAIENPVGIMSTQWRKPDQIIQPWQFGHGEVKATCLWLEGLPKLVPTSIVEGRTPRIHHMAPGPDRSRLRSETYQGIADAMADQWG